MSVEKSRQMKERILAKLEASRKELLDLGMRNPLLNYRPSKARGVHVVQEKPAKVFEILVNLNKSMSFTGRPSKDNNPQELFFEGLNDLEISDAQGDLKLQTNESDTLLQSRLLNTFYAARTSIEEQGVNILFLTLGMLNWYESESSEEIRMAPLILVPVGLERSSAREKFRLKYTGEEIGANISLQAKLKTEFVLNFPNLPDIEDLDIEGYFNTVEKLIRNQSSWKIDHDAIELGFFSFGKFMIYNDLDNSKWPEEKKPVSHPLMTQLFETGFSEEPISADDSSFIDTDTSADDLFQVVDADSSQLLALLAINEGRNLVIQGPPGTGKSQTISNIIGNALGQGKKVLFVAEKMAALEVVKRRLDNIGLGDACLELHSHKANKRDLHIELRRVLDLGRPRTEELEQQVALLKDVKTELNDYCKEINTPIGKSGLTAHKIIGRLLKIENETNSTNLPSLPIPNIIDWNATKFHRSEALAERIEARVKEIGLPNTLNFWGIGLKVIMPSETEKVKQLSNSLKFSLEKLLELVEKITIGLGLFKVSLLKEVDMLIALTEDLSKRPDLSKVNVQSNNWIQYEFEIKDFIKTGKRLKTIRDDYNSVFIPEVWDVDVVNIRKNFAQYGNKWYKSLIPEYGKSKKQLLAYCKGPLPKVHERRLEYTDAILESRRLESLLKEHEGLAIELFGSNWRNLKSDWDLLEKISYFLINIHQKMEARVYPREVLNYLNSRGNIDLENNYSNKLLDPKNKFIDARLLLFEVLKFDCMKKFKTANIENVVFDMQLICYKEWEDHPNEIHKAISWNTLEEIAKEENQLFLTETASSWDNAGTHLKHALQKTWYEFLLEKALNDFSSLRKFERSSHEEIAKQFRKIDQLNFHYNRHLVAHNHWIGMPKRDAGGQVYTLRTEFNKKSRHLPIRKLIQEAGMAIQAIKPVFMMSPLSIANFIPPGSVEFDLVVFDEASQVRPVEALGAILRGKQLVVVGDTKQLPPTSFFDTLLKDVEEEENVTFDLQSILGMCDSQGVPQQMLRWHYRSRHESLISVSNHEFYESKLVIFPSPGSRHRLGLVYHHLKDTAYDRGNTRTNPKEAEIVADAVMHHARQHPGLTLGVAAFSSAQRQAIQDALEIKRKSNTDLEVFFRSHPHEPFFIKNLENVQGDERDVIFISIGYGKTQEGYLSMSFGPLNNEGGERRLNVLITRAKLRCEVFTNLTSEDIDTSRSNKFGIHALKHFLFYAQHGKLNWTQETDKEVESPFEEMVAFAIERHGYIVRKQVGSQGFYIDLAVVDAENPGRYLIGIECDGASYHSARSARDRDRLRQQILEGIGWKLHRIWSTDWFKNPDREIKRVIEAIEKAKVLVHIDDEIEANDEIFTPKLTRDELVSLQDNTLMYEFAILSSTVAQQEIHLFPIGKLSEWIEEIVRVESPVHIDEVARRIVDAGGVTRIGSRIREVILQAVKFSEKQKRISIRKQFLWNVDMTEPRIRNRADMISSSRRMSYIDPEEIGMAAIKVIQDAIAIDIDSAAVLIARLFGFARVTDDMREEITVVINSLIKNEKVLYSGDLLRVNNIK